MLPPASRRHSYVVAISFFLLFSLLSLLLLSSQPSAAQGIPTSTPCYEMAFTGGSASTATPTSNNKTYLPCVATPTPGATLPAARNSNANSSDTNSDASDGSGIVGAMSITTSVISDNYAIVAANDVSGVINAINTANQRTSTLPAYPIYLDSGLYVFNNTSARFPEIVGKVKIFGSANTSIQVSADAPISFRETANAELHNLYITNNRTISQWYSGSVIVNGTVSIYDSWIADSYSLFGAGGIRVGSIPGTATTLNLIRVYFLSNYAGGGAAMQVDSGAQVNGTCVQFDSNRGNYGRAILVGDVFGGGNVSLRYSSFYQSNSQHPQDVVNLHSTSSVVIEDSWWSEGAPHPISGLDYSGNVTIDGVLSLDPHSTNPECFAPSQVNPVVINLSTSVINQSRTAPIPTRDIVEFSIDLTNVTGNTINVDEVEFIWTWKRGTQIQTNPQEVMLINSSVPAISGSGNNQIVWENLYQVSSSYGVIPTGQTKSLKPQFLIKRSGIVDVTIVLTLDDGTVMVSSPFSLDIPITQVNLNDPRVKALMFWMIFNETSEDSFENFFTQPIGSATATPGPTPVNTTFLNAPSYCDSNSSNLGKNNVAGEQAGSQNWLADTSGNIKFVTHCIPPSFQYIEAQTIINGFINAERHSNSTSFISYATNFGGSLALRSYSLWQNYAHCDELQNGQPTGQKLRAYPGIISSASGSRRTLDWLFSYLQCQVNTPSQSSVDTGRALIFARAYSRIMPEVENAISDFYSQPYIDPSDKAFYLKAAAFVNSLGKDQAIKTCVGGCLPNGGGYAQPFTSITQNDVLVDYDVHIQQLQRQISGEPGYNPDYPSILRPVLWTERRELGHKDNNGHFVLDGYEYGGYTWITVVYQESDPGSARHVPR